MNNIESCWRLLPNRASVVAIIVGLLAAVDPAVAQWLPQPPPASGPIYYNGGNVGIGTSTPARTLHVAGATRLQGNLFAGNIADVSKIYLWPDTSGPWIQGTGAGINIFGQGGTISLSNADTSIRGWGGTALTVVGSGASNATVAANITNSAGRSILYVRNDGNVGVGALSPREALDVSGNIIASGNISADGEINSRFQDVAEWVVTSESMVAGTVVVVNRSRNNEVKPSVSAYDTSVAGVVSARPGLILGEKGSGKAKIATTGRVRVRVDATDEPIAAGDLLVTSGKRGFAMKSKPMIINGRPFHQPGTLLGKALEPLDHGEGEILVLLSLQ